MPLNYYDFSGDEHVWNGIGSYRGKKTVIVLSLIFHLCIFRDSGVDVERIKNKICGVSFSPAKGTIGRVYPVN